MGYDVTSAEEGNQSAIKVKLIIKNAQALFPFLSPF